MVTLANVTTGDAYSPETTLEQPDTVRSNIIVSNAAVLYSFKLSPFEDWSDEVFLPPGPYSFVLQCAGARFRSAAAGTPAQVSAFLIGSWEVPTVGD